MLKKLKDFDARDCVEMMIERKNFSVLDELMAYMYVSFVIEQDNKLNLPFKSTDQEIESTAQILENAGYEVSYGKRPESAYYTHYINVKLPKTLTKRLQKETDCENE